MTRVTVHYAQSLDGRLATRTGDSQWIGGAASLRLAHQLRAEHAAVLVGVGTVLADNPRLTVRLVEGPSPRRIVVDSTLRLPLDCHLLTDGAAPTLVATTERASPAHVDALRSGGVDVLTFSANPRGRVDLRRLFERLELDSVLIEGGGEVITSALCRTARAASGDLYLAQGHRRRHRGRRRSPDPASARTRSSSSRPASHRSKTTSSSTARSPMPEATAVWLTQPRTLELRREPLPGARPGRRAHRSHCLGDQPRHRDARLSRPGAARPRARFAHTARQLRVSDQVRLRQRRARRRRRRRRGRPDARRRRVRPPSAPVVLRRAGHDADRVAARPGPHAGRVSGQRRDGPDDRAGRRATPGRTCRHLRAGRGRPAADAAHPPHRRRACRR